MPDFTPAIQLLEHGIKFVENSGLKVLELRRGYVKCLMPFKGNGNHIGTMYAGALFTLAEIPGGALFLSSFDVKRFYPIVKDLQIGFRKPAKADITIEVTLTEERIAAIEQEATANGKAEYTLESELKDGSGTVVAVAKGLYQLRQVGR